MSAAAMEPIKNSATHPLRIDFVRPGHGWAEIGMSFCPGKKQTEALSGNWDRDLDLDLDRIKDWGAAMVVSLLEEQEFSDLRVNLLPQKVLAARMQWRHLPIRDNFAPDSRFHDLWPTVGKEIIELLSAGRRVFLHCKGGLGRTGTVAACLLIEAGLMPGDAVERVRAARRHTIETALQEWYVLNYQSIIGSRGSYERA